MACNNQVALCYRTWCYNQLVDIANRDLQSLFLTVTFYWPRYTLHKVKVGKPKQAVKVFAGLCATFSSLPHSSFLPSLERTPTPAMCCATSHLFIGCNSQVASGYHIGTAHCCGSSQMFVTNVHHKCSSQMFVHSLVSGQAHVQIECYG